ncbi:hypothetical protein [Campylobacter helveticus]|nr:hypothetical protein [Campylobacter helveticus]
MINKNLNALRNETLRAELSAITHSNCKAVFGKDSLELNIINWGVL